MQHLNKLNHIRWGDLMAKSNDRAISKANKNISKLAKGVTDNINSIYRSTYMTNTNQSDDLKKISDDINNSLDKIVNKNMDMFGKPSMSSFYSRLAISGRDNDEKLVKDIGDMFDNGTMTDDLYSVFMTNKYLKELDNEIDTICKYMPKLEEALAVQKDCVLSADHFSKDFLALSRISPSITSEAIFSERCKNMKLKYRLPSLVEEIYENTSKYGEEFIYRVPYSLAIGKLLANKDSTMTELPVKEASEISNSNDNEIFMLSLNSESCIIKDANKSTVLKENALSQNSNNNHYSDAHILKQGERFNIGIEICTSGILESAVIETYNAINNKTKKYSSLASVYESSVINETDKEIEADKFGRPKNIDTTYIASNDGLIMGKEKDPVKVKMPGCVIKRCPRELVYPIYIEDICMGYYYFEIHGIQEADNYLGFKTIFSDSITNTKIGDAANPVDNSRQDETLKYVASQLSKFIDKKFVNANQDLSREIYMILKYNDEFNSVNIDSLKVTFIPPEDMVHFFFKQDPITHRGISDLEKGLVPAKIYASLYITTSIGNLTRSMDKRVYYVKQTVDKNIAQSLLNVINQIKQSNFGIRQFQNINNVLNITGRFNDYVIPTNASGDAPIQFEVMPGQEIQTPTELMQTLEEAAINSTGIPIEIIQTRQSVDYAMQLTMSSSKVLRFCYKRQELFQDLLCELITPIYNYEYNENVKIKVTLPPPSFINVTNTNQLVNNTKEFVNSIVETDMAGNDDEALKNEYTNELTKYYLGTHLDIAKHQEIFDKSKLKVASERNESHSDDSGSEY